MNKIRIDSDMALKIANSVIMNDINKPATRFTSIQQEQERDALAMQLEGKEIYKACIPELKRKLFSKYIATRMPKGASVGLIAAQAFSQPLTQIILKSQHHAGKEFGAKPDELLASLLSLGSANGYTILHHSNVDMDVDELTSWASKFEVIYVKDVLKNVLENTGYRPMKIDVDPDASTKKLTKAELVDHEFYPAYFRIFGDDILFPRDFHVRFYLDLSKIYLKRVPYCSILEAIAEIPGARPVPSPVSQGLIDVYFQEGMSQTEIIAAIKLIHEKDIVGYKGVRGYEVKTLLFSDVVISIDRTDTGLVLWYDMMKELYFSEKRMRNILCETLNVKNKHIKYDKAKGRIIVKGEFDSEVDWKKSIGKHAYHYVKIIGNLPPGFEIEEYNADGTPVGDDDKGDKDDDLESSQETTYKRLRQDIDHSMTIFSNHEQMIAQYGMESTLLFQELSFYDLLESIGHAASNIHYKIMAAYQLTGTMRALRASTNHTMNKGLIEKSTYQEYKRAIEVEPAMAKYYPLDPFSSLLFGQKINIGTGFHDAVISNEGIAELKQRYEQEFNQQYENGLKREHLNKLEAIAGFKRMYHSGLIHSGDLPSEQPCVDVTVDFV